MNVFGGYIQVNISIFCTQDPVGFPYACSSTPLVLGRCTYDKIEYPSNDSENSFDQFPRHVESVSHATSVQLIHKMSGMVGARSTSNVGRSQLWFVIIRSSGSRNQKSIKTVGRLFRVVSDRTELVKAPSPDKYAAYSYAWANDIDDSPLSASAEWSVSFRSTPLWTHPTKTS